MGALALVRAQFGSRSPAFRQALIVTVATRTLVWLAAILSAVVIGAKQAANASFNDVPYLTAPAGSVGRVLLTPLAHWDAVWYLSIVKYDYATITGVGQARAAFFPLYPLLVWLGSGLAASFALELIVAFAVSLAAFAGALYLLHRLVALELGGQYALPTLVLLALFPGALFFGIPYAEALFLLVSVGAFYAVRTGHWAWAGMLAGAASATRSAGLLLILPLAVLYLYGPRADAQPRARSANRLVPRYQIRANLLWLALAPLGLLAYSAYLGIRHGDGFAWMHVQAAWSRHFAGPFGGVVSGASAAWKGVHDLATGATSSVYLQHGQLEPTRAAIANVTLFAFLLGAAVATWGTFRRLPAAYGVWLLAALGLALSYPADAQPLESLPRFLAVLFPLFMWLAAWAQDRRKLELTASIFAALLGLLAAQYAGWEFVS